MMILEYGWSHAYQMDWDTLLTGFFMCSKKGGGVMSLISHHSQRNGLWLVKIRPSQLDMGRVRGRGFFFPHWSFPVPISPVCSWRCGTMWNCCCWWSMPANETRELDTWEGEKNALWLAKLTYLMQPMSVTRTGASGRRQSGWRASLNM